MESKKQNKEHLTSGVENLTAFVLGIDLNIYQRVHAQLEFNQLLEQRNELLVCLEIYNKCMKEGLTNEIEENYNKAKELIKKIKG